MSISLERPRQQTLSAIAVIGFVVITVLRLVVGSGPDAVSILYVVPIASAALRSGLVGGITAIAAAIWLLAGVRFFLADAVDFAFLGFSVRIAAFAVSGLGLGWSVDRMRAAESRHVAYRMQVEAERRHRLESPIAPASTCDHIPVLARVVDAKRALERSDRLRALAILESAGGSANDLAASLPDAHRLRDVL